MVTESKKKIIQIPVDVEFEELNEEKEYPFNWDYAEAGINPADFEKPLPDTQLTMFQRFIIGIPENSYMKAYVNLLKNTKIESDYFSEEEDGRVARYVKAFFDAEFGTPQGELVTMNLHYYCNKVISNILHGDQKPKFRFAAFGDFFSGNDSKDGMSMDELKQLAWFVTHSYVTGLFVSPKNIYECMNEIYDFQAENWNKYILMQEDIPDGVKEIFFINFESDHISKYFEMYTISEGFTKMPETKSLGPTDDIPVDDSDTVAGHTVPLDEKDVKLAEQKHEELNAQFKEAVKNDTTDEDKKEELKPMQEQPKAEQPATVKQESAEPVPVKEEAKKPAQKAKDKVVNIPTPKYTAPVYTGKKGQKSEPNPPAPEKKPEPKKKLAETPVVNATSHDIEIGVPGLSKLNEIIGKFLFNAVYYPANEVGYPGLILGKVFNNNAGPEAVRDILIDPYIIYGDTIRIIPFVPEDIRTAPAIPIYNESMVMKAISGGFTDQDAVTVMSDIPGYVKGVPEGKKYGFLDRVDLRNLRTNGTPGMPQKKWRALIKNINGLLAHPSIPQNTRFTVFTNEQSKGHEESEFYLICNTQVMSSFYTEILAEPEHAACANEGLIITYSESQIPAPNFTVSKISNAQ